MNPMQLTLLADDRLADLRREAARRGPIAVRKPSPPKQDPPTGRPALRLLAAPLTAVARRMAWAASGR